MSTVVPFIRRQKAIEEVFQLMTQGVGDYQSKRFSLTTPDRAAGIYCLNYLDSPLFTLKIITPAELDEFVDTLDPEYDVSLPTCQFDFDEELFDSNEQIHIDHLSFIICNILYRKLGVFYKDEIFIVGRLFALLKGPLIAYRAGTKTQSFSSIIVYHDNSYIECITTARDLIRFAEISRTKRQLSIRNKTRFPDGFFSYLNAATISSIYEYYLKNIPEVNEYFVKNGPTCDLVLSFESDGIEPDVLFSDMELVVKKPLSTDTAKEIVRKRLSSIEITYKVNDKVLYLQNLLALLIRNVIETNDAMFMVPWHALSNRPDMPFSISFWLYFDYTLVDIDLMSSVKEH